MRQIERFQEPWELRELRRFADIGATQIRSIYDLSGRIHTEFRVDGKWISTFEASGLKEKAEALKHMIMLSNRSQARLGKAIPVSDIGNLTPVQLEHLKMSQKDWNLFRRQQNVGNEVPVLQGPATPITGPNVGLGSTDPNERAALYGALVARGIDPDEFLQSIGGKAGIEPASVGKPVEVLEENPTDPGGIILPESAPKSGKKKSAPKARISSG